MIQFCGSRYTCLNGGEFYADGSADEVVAFAESLASGTEDEPVVNMTWYPRFAGRDGCWPDEPPVVVVALATDVLELIDNVRGAASRAEWMLEAARQRLAVSGADHASDKAKSVPGKLVNVLRR